MAIYLTLVLPQNSFSHTLSLLFSSVSAPLSLSHVRAHTHTHSFIHTQANSLIQSLSSLYPFCHFLASLSQFFTYLSPILWQERGRTETQGERERERETEREREREREREWWKARSKTGKLIFFFGTPLLLTASGTEYKLINLPGCTCYDTQGKPGIRYGSPAQAQSGQKISEETVSQLNIWDYI